MTADLHSAVQPRQQFTRPAGSLCDERISLRSVDEQHRTLQLTQRVPWVDRMVEDFGFQPFRTGERPLAVFIARGVFDEAIKRIVTPDRKSTRLNSSH